MTERQPDHIPTAGETALRQAQQLREVARGEFFRLLIASIARLLEAPGEIDAITRIVVAESDRVSDSLTATDHAMLARILELVTPRQEQALATTDHARRIVALEAAVAELRGQLPHQGEP